MKDGKVQYVTREEVQYVLPSGQDMFSFTSNLVPLISGIKGGRLLMGSKIMNQALPLQAPEAPLVQAATADNPDQSFEELYGSQLMGAIRADQPGRVVSVNDDMMKVKYADGSTADVELYNNFTMNQKSQLHNTAMLKPGDEFKKGDLIAKSNFTDDNGTTAIGRNLRVAFLPYKGNYEDGIVISESAAKNLSSEHAYQVKFDPQDAGVEVGKKQFISRYPGKFNREQLDKIGDDGLVKPGTVLDEGDPMVLSTKTRKPTRGTAILKQQKNWTNDHSVVWDHHTPGIVTNVYGSDRSIKVMTKTYMPAERGDKLCFDAKTELMTNKGWVPVSEVGFNTRLATLNSTTGHLEYDNPTELHRIPNTRGEVPTFNVIDHVNYNSQTTMEHKHLVRLPGESAFALVPAKELINKTFEIKKTSKGLINKQVASISCPYIGENRRSNISYVALIMQLFKFRELISFKLFGRQLVLKTHLFPTDAAARILKTAGYADIKNKITANDRKLKISDSQLVSELKEIFANTADFMQQVLLTENYTLIRIFCTHALQSSLVHTYKQEMTLNGYTEQECSIMHAMCVATGLPSDLYTRINYGRNGEFLEQKILTIYPQDMQFIVNADPRENKHQTVIRPSESGSFYCVTVPNHIVMVRRGGTAYWSGNSNRYGGKGTIGAIYPDDQMPKDQNGQAFEAVLNPLGIISRCYDDQTEFLTRRGWLKGDTVESSDELVQWEPETGTLAYTEQIAPFYKSQYKGAMIGYQDMSADFMVTPNHKFMVKPHKATQEWTECTAEELLDMPLQRKVLAPVHGQMGDLGKYGEPVTYKGLTMDPILLCDLAGFLYRRVHFKTEGRDLVYAVKSGTDMFDKFMDWAQKHDSIKWRYDQLEEVVKFMDKEVHEFVREFDLTDFIKKVVLKAPRDARDIFFDSLVLYRPRVMVKESDVAALQHAAVLSNMTVYPKALTKEGMCEVRIGSPGTTSICRSNTPGFFEQDYDGMIYCPSVLSGYIVTRRNGKVLIAGNTNPSQMVETLLAKVARKTGKPYKLPAFSDKDMIEYALDELKNAGLEETELVEDPATNRQLKDIFTGEQFLMKLHHVSSSKLSERDTGSYSMDHTPSRGKFGGSKRMGTLETMSLVGHGATEVLKDARLVRGQKNDEYWQRYKMGMPVRTPRNSYMYDKFLDMLRASGVNVEREGSHINIMAMTDRDIMEISGDRALKSGDAINSKTQEPIKGGLFDLGLTGGKEGSRFARIDLDTPIPHPVMEEPIIRLLGMTKQKFRDAISDDSEFSQMQQKLAQMNVDDEIERNLAEIKSGKKSKRDLAVKRLKYLTGMKKAGIEPSELLINHIPVLPPKFRPIAKMNDMELTSDANLLYKDLFEANNLYRDLKGATDNSGEERVNLYDAAKAVVGLGDPINVKNKEKNVAGLLTHVFGKQGPKFGLVQRKLLGTTVDQVGRAVISPDNSLDIDQVGLPETAAWGIYRPHVMRRLVKRYNAGSNTVPMTTLAKWIQDKDPRAKEALLAEMKERPIIYSRAPTWHKFGVMGAWPVLREDDDTLSISPLVTKGFGADFDGDTMNFHVPASDKAVKEVIEKMMPSKNLLAEADFEPSYLPQQEFLLGLYKASRKAGKQEPHKFASKQDAIKAFLTGNLAVDAPIKIV